MTSLIVIAAGVLVIGFFHLIAGWYFANGVRREALTPRPPIRDLGVWVRAIEGERIDLVAKGPRQDIGHPGVFGLAWQGGHARVGEVLAATDVGITRSFSAEDGQLPPICEGPLDDCPPVELDGYFYPDDPADAGLEFEEVTYESNLGPMGAWLVPGDTREIWAIHCHGWTAERREHLRMLPTFHSTGRTSLVIDYRNDLGAPFDPSGRYRFGMTEWEDLEAAVRYASDRGASNMILTGCSTGGALVMRFLEVSGLAGIVRGVVLDAPNIVLADTFRHVLRAAPGSRLVKETGLVIADWRWNIDWEKTDFVSRADRILQVPTLVFHGAADQTVPISESRRLAAMVPNLVELVETPAAGHVLSWNADPQRYETHLARFLAQVDH